MLTPVFGGINSAPSTSVVNYASIVGCFTPSPTATETARLCVCPGAFTLGNLYVSVNASPGTGKQYTFTVRKNQVATAITLVISDSATSGVYTGASVSFAAGDLITISMTPSGTPTAPTQVLWNLQADSGGTHFSLLLGGGQITTGLSTSVASYAALTGTSNSSSTTWSATEAQQEIICPTAGTISDLYVKADASPGTAKSYAIALVQNGSTSSLSATVSGSNTTANDTTHSITVAANDKLSVAATPSGTPTAARYVWGFKFTPTNAGESFFGFGNANAPSTTATQYELPNGTGDSAYNSTESSRQIALGACMLTALYALLGTAPGGSTTRILTIRRNAVSTPLAVSFTSTGISGNITGQSVGLSQTSLISLQAAETGTPAADTGGVHIGVLLFIPVSTPATGGFFGAMR